MQKTGLGRRGLLDVSELGRRAAKSGCRGYGYTCGAAKERGWRAIDLLANPVKIGTVSIGAVGISWMPEDNLS